MQLNSSLKTSDCKPGGVFVSAQKGADSVGAYYHASGNLFVIHRGCKSVPKAVDAKRTEITSFSASSGCRMRRYLRSCLAEYRHMVTLTYPFTYPTSGDVCKEHLRRFLQEFKRECGRMFDVDPLDDLGFFHSDWSAFWFLEFQERGAPHFHIFTTHSPGRKWVSNTWYRICNTEDPRHLAAGTRTEEIRGGRSGMAAYASKYAAKMAQKAVPDNFSNCGRFWGVWGYRATLSADTFVPASYDDDRSIIAIRNRIKQTLTVAKAVGSAELIKKSEDVAIWSIKTKPLQQKMRLLVLRMSNVTFKWSSMFDDAELET